EAWRIGIARNRSPSGEGPRTARVWIFSLAPGSLMPISRTSFSSFVDPSFLPSPPSPPPSPPNAPPSALPLPLARPLRPAPAAVDLIDIPGQIERGGSVGLAIHDESGSIHFHPAEGLQLGLRVLGILFPGAWTPALRGLHHQVDRPPGQSRQIERGRE